MFISVINEKFHFTNFFMDVVSNPLDPIEQGVYSSII
jgi:hypothetical protein